MTTSIHAMALDGIVNVNSLFTVATFLGLALNPADPSSTLLLNPASSACTATSAIAKHLVAYHVYAFSSFLFSSLVAFAIKQAIRTTHVDGVMLKTHVDLRALRAGILASAAGSASGCVFLTLALVDLVQIKLGVCWSWYTLAALAPLVALVPSALVTYICLVLHAFAR